MTKEGRIHVYTNKWGKVAISEEALEEEVKESNNISKAKYVFEAADRTTSKGALTIMNAIAIAADIHVQHVLDAK